MEYVSGQGLSDVADDSKQIAGKIHKAILCGTVSVFIRDREMLLN